jgi:WD40 repeat protein
MNALPQRSAWLLLLVFAVSDAAGQTLRTDALGDPLPEGAVLRFGSTRLRHAGPIRSIVFSPDGKLLATAGDRSVRLWDVTNGKLVRSFPLSYPGAMAFAPDAKTLAIGKADGYHIGLWDVASGVEEFQLKISRAQKSFTFTADGKKLLAGQDLGVVLWDLETKKKLVEYKTEGWQNGVVLTPDEKLVIAVNGWGKLQFFKIDEEKAFRSQEVPADRHAREPYGFALSRDGKKLGIAMSSFILILDPASGNEVGRITDLGRYQNGLGGRLAFSPDGKTLALGSNGAAIRLFDMASAKEKIYLDCAIGWPQPVAISPDGKTVASGGWDGIIRMWDTTTGKDRLIPVGHRATVDALALSPDGKRLVTSGSDAKVCLWNAATAALLHSHKLPDSAGSTALFFSPDGRFFASGGPRGSVRWHEGATGRIVLIEPKSPANYLTGLGLSSDALFMVFSTSYGKLHVLQPESGESRWSKQLKNYDTQAVAVSPDGKHIVSAGNKTIRCWESGTGKQLWHGVGASPALAAVSYSRDGRTLVTGAADGKLQVWDARTGKDVRTLAPLRGIAGALAFSPDGQVLACAARGHPPSTRGTPADPDVILWDTATWKELGRLSGHDGGVSGICFAPDGRALYSASHDGTVLKWDWLQRITAHTKTKEASAISERTWAALGNDDVKSAYAAISQLIAAREPAVKLLAAKLKPIPALEPKRLPNLIRDLSSDRFAMRDAATRELRALGQRSEDALHEALKANHPVETRMRIEQLLAERRRSPYSTQELQDLRGIQVLGADRHGQSPQDSGGPCGRKQ